MSGLTTILVTGEAVQMRDRLADRLDGLPVVLADVGSGPAEVLMVGQHAVDDVRVGLDAGVRWIQSLATGVETVLTPEVVASDVIVTNSSGATAGPVAEFTFARILEHATRLRRVADSQNEHTWDRFFHDDLEGSTIAVVGLGAIGQRVVSLAKAFGMTVLGVRRRPGAGAGSCDAIFGPHDLPDVMERSDYVVLLAALTPETRGLMSREVLARAKPGCLIVNVGRAELVDHDALMEAAATGRVVAALDVVPSEPLPPDHPLWDAPGIAISSHIATWTPKIVDSLVDLVAENVRRFVDGAPLLNVVDKRVGYVAS
jgi:phosphoglycerate dehydrogenase-like enzyme